MTNPTLTIDETILLQQLHEYGEEDIRDISSELHKPRQSVLVLLQRLKRKGLITIETAYGDMLVMLSPQGKRFVHATWPEF